MKIGIITFHWVPNYGAVLQAFALQKFLISKGHEVEIIDYYPNSRKVKAYDVFLSRSIKAFRNKKNSYLRDKKISVFRKKNLILTKHYTLHTDLKRTPPIYDCYICGSDQIWNYSFIQQKQGTNQNNYTYYLDFAPDDKILISYAASFGIDFDEEYKVLLQDIFERFDFVSVRENSAVEIAEKHGIVSPELVPDPTLLLDPKEYKKFVKPSNGKDYAFSYILHNKEHEAQKLLEKVKKDGISIKTCGSVSIEKWLSNIYNSKIVITNSFHGVVFSIIFQKPFVVVLIGNSPMNDRLNTLLEKLSLQDRIYNGDINILNKPIDWITTNEKLSSFRKKGYDFLNKVLSYEKGINK